MNIEAGQIVLGDIRIDVFQKRIQNLHLSVHPPTGRVRIAAPIHMNLDTIRVFALSKLAWIKKHQNRLRNQERETPREYITRESHYFLGKRFLLKVIEQQDVPKVILKHSTLELFVRDSGNYEIKKNTIDAWYRNKLKEIVPRYITKWSKVMNVEVAEFRIKRMKRKWGSCNRKATRIWLNLELAKKPVHCIEYLVVHEMIHLLERHHNERFYTLLNHYLPQWKQYRKELNESVLTC